MTKFRSYLRDHLDKHREHAPLRHDQYCGLSVLTGRTVDNECQTAGYHKPHPEHHSVELKLEVKAMYQY